MTLYDLQPSALTTEQVFYDRRFALGAGSIALTKQLFLAAKQLFLAAKHAVVCMSLPTGRFQRELSARQPSYTSGP